MIMLDFEDGKLVDIEGISARSSPDTNHLEQAERPSNIRVTPPSDVDVAPFSDDGKHRRWKALAAYGAKREVMAC